MWLIGVPFSCVYVTGKGVDTLYLHMSSLNIPGGVSFFTGICSKVTLVKVIQ